MKQILNVLIVDNQPLMMDVYDKALQEVERTDGSIRFRIFKSHDCETANFQIERALESAPFHLALLDVKLMPSRDGQFVSGEDIGLKLMKHFKDLKLVVVTSQRNNYVINNVLKSINPSGMLVKTELNFEVLVEAVKSVMVNCPFYSASVLKIMRNQIASNFTLDTIDRQILYQLSQGTKTKNLTDILPLSLAGIEKRKRLLKEVFEARGNSDRTLVRLAKEKGFI